MAYLHEMALNDAMKKLYMLGGPDQRRDRTSFDEYGDGALAVGKGIASAIKGGGAKPVPSKVSATNEKDSAKAKALMKLTGANKGLRMEEVKDSQRRADIEKAMKRLSMYENDRIFSNELAGQTRMGGKLPLGQLHLTDVTAQQNAEDRLKAKALMGIGGTISKGYGY